MSADLRRVLADLVEAVSRGDEVGLPEAYRAARAALATLDEQPKQCFDGVCEHDELPDPAVIELNRAITAGIDVHQLSDLLGNLVAATGRRLSDDGLDDLTHLVAGFLADTAPIRDPKEQQP